MKNRYAETDIKKLSSREHVLLRPNMYIGSVSKVSSEEFILDEEEKLVKKQVTYVPGLLKIINEIIDNAIDESVRTNYDFANVIRIDITEKSVSVEDNGRGIPVKKIEGTDHYMPVAAFCQARTGANFEDDENRSTIGMNGVGSFATNVFSSLFKVDTCDGENKLSLVCENNLKKENFSIRKNSKQFTTVEFEPDFSQFEIDKLDKNHIDIIYQRILFLSVSHPQVKFFFNKKRVRVANEKSFMSLFSDSFELLTGDGWFVGVFPNEEDNFSFFSYVNGLYIKTGGNHVNLISNEIVSRIRDKLVKKYKTIKPGDIRNKLSLVVFFNGFKNMKFDSQTKENLTNSTAEIRDYMKLEVADWDNFGKKILRNTDLIEPIVEMFRIKEEFKKKQELKKLSSNKKKVQNDKYYPPIGEKKYLLLSEGDSATAGLQPVFGRQGIGYFSLRGKPLNTFDTKILKMVANKEIQAIVDILNLDLTDPNTNMEYEKVVFASDQDADGIHIRSLLLTFFFRFTPALIEQGRIVFLQTPLVVGKKKNDIKEWYFSMSEYQDSTSDLEWQYKKGLGSWTKKDLQEIVEKTGGMDSLLVSFSPTEKSKESITSWMKGTEANARKEKLYGKKFNISTL